MQGQSILYFVFLFCLLLFYFTLLVVFVLLLLIFTPAGERVISVAPSVFLEL